MGGYGSGRDYYSVKTLVEECYPLPTSAIREHLIRVDVEDFPFKGNLNWTCGGKPSGNIGYSIKKISGVLIVRLDYSIRQSSGESEKFDYPVYIQYTYPNYGGKRYWFTCPLTVNGIPCKRRVAKLYLPPGSKYFGCRHCHDLTYTSSRESHRWDNLWRSLGLTPEQGKMMEYW